MNRGIALAAICAAAIALAGALVLRDWARSFAPPPSGESTRADGAPAVVPSAPAVDSASPPDKPPEAGREDKPASLRGTRVDGALITDAEGRFVPTPDARRLFDYFLTASGEEPEDVIVMRIRAEIDVRLSPDAARDAHLLLDRYLVYRARARELAENGLADADLDDRLEALRALRRETLGEEAAAAFFAEEEAIDQAMIEKHALAESGLSPPEREARMAEIEASLPEDERARRRAATKAIELRAEESRVLAQGGSPEDLRALRERSVGPEAAERLAALDAERAEWRRRVDDYREARERIERDEALDQDSRARAIERLRVERFSDTERLRVEAIDEIELR